MSKESTSSTGLSYIFGSNLNNSIKNQKTFDYLDGAFSNNFFKVSKQISEEKSKYFDLSIAAPPFQITEDQEKELKKFIYGLEAFFDLNNRWTLQACKPPSVVALFMAFNTCLVLIQNGFNTPTPKILSDGTLGMFWSHDKLYAAIDLEDDGEHVWTVTDGKNIKSGTWQIRENTPKDFYETFLLD